MFGQNKSTFGGAGSFGFGQQTNAATQFGQNAFGAKPPSSTPGGFSTFGSTAQPSLFGSSANAAGSSTLFGGTSTFGQTAPTTSSFGFGATPAGSGIFGQTPQQSQVAPSTGGLFGSTMQNKPSFGFGSTPGTGSLFSQQSVPGQTQPTQQNSLFGQAGGNTGLFGSTAFSSTPGNTGQIVGTTFKFNPPTGSDTMMKSGVTHNICTRHQCITCMKEYENKSLEELQLEDYMANRKGSQQTGAGGSLFGATPAQPSLFSNTANTSVGGGLFGQQQNKPAFGTAGTSTFGSGFFNQNQPGSTSGGGLFNKPTTGFGSTATTNSFGFGSTNTQTGLFGSAQQKPFGAVAPQTGATNLFGTPATTQQSTSVFGSNTSGGFGMFGQQQQTQQPGQSGGLFGNMAAKPGFGLNTSTSSFGFNSNTTTPNAGSSLFGSKPAGAGFSSFGSTTNQTPAFGTTGLNTGATGLFSNANKPATTPFSFGQTSTAGPALGSGLGLGSGSLFGGANKTTGSTGLFGTTTPSFGLGTGNTLGGSTGLGTMSGFGTNTGFSGGSSLGFGTMTGLGNTTTGLGSNMVSSAVPANETSVVAQQQILALASSPFGDSPLFRNVLTSSGKREEVLKPTNPAAQKAVIAEALNFKITPTTVSKLRPRASGLRSSNSGVVRSGLFDGLDDDDGLMLGAEVFVPRQSVKRLSLKPKSPEQMNSFQNQKNQEQQQQQLSPVLFRDQLIVAPADSSMLQPKADSIVNRETRTRPQIQPIPLREFDLSSHAEVSSSLEESNVRNDTVLEPELADSPAHAAGIVLNRPGYYIIPPLDELASLVDGESHCEVDSLTIGRENYGSIFFKGPLNVYGLNLDEIVHIRHKEVVVYPDDDIKPPEGEGLNRPATVTLDRVWPLDKTTHEPITDAVRLQELRYEEKLVRACGKLGASFVDYRPESGSWVFRVKHFSKYGLTDSDEEDGSVTLGKDGKVVEKPKSKPMQAPVQQKQILDKKSEITGTPQQHPKASPISAPAVMQAPLAFRHSPISPPLPDVLEEDQSMDDEEEEEDEEPSEDGEYEPLQFTSPVTDRSRHLLKLSFFNEMDDCEEVKGRQTPTKKLATPSRLLRAHLISSPKVPIHVEDMIVSDSPIQAAPSVRAKVYGPRPPVVALCHDHNRTTELKNSLFANANAAGVIADSALTHGRAMRVGWGPSWQYTSLSSTVNNVVNVCDLVQTVSAEETICEPLVAMLKKYLELAEVSEEDNKCVKLGCRRGIDIIHAMASVCRQLEENTDVVIAKHVWELCEALWGKLDTDSHDGSESEQNDYSADETSMSTHNWHMLRKKSVSRWFESTLQTTKRSHADGIMKLLTEHKVREACKVAQSEKSHRIALLLAQAGCVKAQQRIQYQLSSWTESGADKFISKDRLAHYVLASGMPTWDGTQKDINLCDVEDWRTAFRLHLWHLVPYETTIPELVNKYNEACKSYAPKPHPAYVQRPDLGSKVPVDVCYHLLQLFSDKSHPIGELMTPSSYTSNPLNQSLCWFLCQALQALGFSHIADYRKASLHEEFAAKLESAGLWHWAIMVLLHLENSESRIEKVKSVLLRNLTLEVCAEEIEREVFLQQKLFIPSSWIWEGKAQIAHTNESFHNEAWCLLKAEKFPEAHRLVVQHIAPDALLNGKLDHLATFLEVLAASSATIPNWNTSGQVFWDYIQTVRNVGNISATDGPMLFRMVNSINSLGVRISALDVHTPKEYLCQAEMAKRVAYITRAAVDSGAVTLASVAEPMINLPMPEDYALQELRYVTQISLSETLNDKAM